MDISTLKPKDSYVHLEHPGTGEELGLVFTMRSRHSDEVQKVTEQYEARRAKKRGRARAASAGEQRAYSISLILASVTDWEWQDEELTFGGEQPAYSREVLKRWLKEYPWMLEFFSREFLEDENFFTA